jgi:hypothetical protein
MAVRSYRSSQLQHKRTLRRKIVSAPHQSATAPQRNLFAASMNRGSFYNTSALHWIVMVGGILDALTIFRLSLNHIALLLLDIDNCK